MSDKLEVLTAKADRVRELELEIADVEARLSRLKGELFTLQETVLPDLLNELRMPDFTLDARGNMPAITVARKPYYAAGVPVGWEPEKRDAAFEEIEKFGGGSLVRSTVTIELPKGKLDVIEKIKEAFPDYEIDVRKQVNAKSLGTWLRELVENHKRLPDLDKIGGRIGTRVEVSRPKKK